jgi:Dimethlysulfonioproprionate lyase
MAFLLENCLPLWKSRSLATARNQQARGSNALSAAANLLGLVRNYAASFEDAVVLSFTETIDRDMTERRLDPAGVPCLGHLDRASEMAPTLERPILMALAESRNHFRWGQTYTAGDLGERFLANYGWMELFGARGHFVNNTIAAGFLVLGPHTHYPDHHHVAEELYVPLTPGTEWKKGEGDFLVRRAGEVIHHPSNVRHAMRTSSEPLVALYFWRGGPLDQKSVVTAATPLEGRPGVDVEVS